MSVFGSRMTPERLAADLLSGIERGELALDDEAPDDARAEQLAERVTALVEQRLAPVLAQLQTLIESAVVILQQAKAAQFDKVPTEGKGAVIYDGKGSIGYEKGVYISQKHE